MPESFADKGLVVFRISKYDLSREASMLSNAAIAKIPKRATIDVQLFGPLGRLTRKMVFVRTAGGQIYLADAVTGSLYELNDGWCATSETLAIEVTDALRDLVAGLNPGNDAHF